MQPLDHFARLGFEPGFAVDQALLQKRYFEAQRRFHPDRFATATARERVLSQSQAAAINDAYETLKDPLKRAGYLLKLKGVDVTAEGCNTLTDPVLLMEAMEMREALAEADSVAAVEDIRRRTEIDIQECLPALAEAFAADDLHTAERLATRLKYLTKLAEEGRSRRNRLR